jgi:hypothetical protein
MATPDKFYIKSKIDGKYRLKPRFGYKVEWEDLNGKIHMDLFIPPDGKSHEGQSYIHMWPVPLVGLVQFLQNLPMHNTTITIHQL